MPEPFKNDPVFRKFRVAEPANLTAENGVNMK
jgi:hypothetical protein